MFDISLDIEGCLNQFTKLEIVETQDIKKQDVYGDGRLLSSTLDVPHTGSFYAASGMFYFADGSRKANGVPLCDEHVKLSLIEFLLGCLHEDPKGSICALILLFILISLMMF